MIEYGEKVFGKKMEGYGFGGEISASIKRAI